MKKMGLIGNIILFVFLVSITFFFATVFILDLSEFGLRALMLVFWGPLALVSGVWFIRKLIKESK